MIYSTDISMGALQWQLKGGVPLEASSLEDVAAICMRGPTLTNEGELAYGSYLVNYSGKPIDVGRLTSHNHIYLRADRGAIKGAHKADLSSKPHLEEVGKLRSIFTEEAYSWFTSRDWGPSKALGELLKLVVMCGQLKRKVTLSDLKRDTEGNPLDKYHLVAGDPPILWSQLAKKGSLLAEEVLVLREAVIDCLLSVEDAHLLWECFTRNRDVASQLTEGRSKAKTEAKHRLDAIGSITSKSKSTNTSTSTSTSLREVIYDESY